ncbi:SMC family ATPase [Peribacillus frigoritolerans]|uniref:AAA family ATPase n=1 Tax=Peribacillus frigoritolerans TaxID=450367 RepID=UPI00207B0B43|nr:SMC family ATPase [Peribacillus frigoritolerans]USK82111.1 SMC family ATPase [Peribacillus frigoritolerans]WJE49404.1 SMC family ATPase [Peribacillus frigoritolerans]
MKIKKIEINNFRNYYGIHRFNLDKNITILFGENGYGKSSFFDAIEWCITNEIERFKAQDGELNFNNNDCVNYMAKEEENPACHVSIYYDDYRLHRKYSVSSNHTGVFLYKNEGQSEVLVAQGQKNVEYELYKYKENIKNGGAKLIKHSYVLSQDQITNFIRSNPKERFDSLASIMGINKVTNFIDNLKTSNSFIQSIYTTTENNFNNNRKLIEERKSDREEQNQLTKKINESIESLNTIKVLNYQNDKNFNLEKLDHQIKEVSKKLAEKNHKISTIKNVPSEFSNYNSLKSKRLYLEKEHEEKINLLTKAEGSRNLANKEIDSLSSSFKRIIEERKLLEIIDNKKLEIKKIYDELNENKHINLKNEVVQQKLNESRKHLQKIDFILLYMEDYQKGKKELTSLPNIIKECETETLILERKIKNRKKLLESLRKWLDNNNASSSLQGLVQYLQGISDYVKNNDVQGTCPVCSTPLGDSLENKIQHNIIQHAARITELEILVVKAFELQERKESELSLFLQEVRNLEQKITRLKRQVENASEALRNITLNPQFDYNLFNSNKVNVMEIKTKLTEEIQNLEDFREKKSNLMSLEHNYKSLLESLNIKKVDGELEATLRLKEHRLSRKIIRLNKLINNIKERIIINKKERDTILLYISQLNSVDNLLSEDQEFAIIIKQLDKNIKSLEIDYQLLGRIKELTIKVNEKIESINILTRYEENEEELIKEMTKWSRKMEQLDEYIKNLTSEVGEHALKFLNHPHSKIQQYYRYLNPIPTTNGKIKFITDNTDETKRGLSITLPHKKNNGEHEHMNARYTLSSAQLNTLAIAIFLVVNDSQDVGIFDFVAIDDPIQNMDDVNQYTMCDILGDINKQLLFSTHDLDFLKLFIKKNEYKKEDIRVYFLETPNLLDGRVKEVTF